MNPIIAALKNLDVANDAHWTADGAPRLSALKIEGLTREAIAAVAPHFTRTNPVIDAPAVVADKVAVVKAKQIEEAKDRRSEIEKELEVAREEEARLTKAAQEATQEARKASAKTDALTRALAAYDSSRSGQADIMDYIAKANEQRMAKAMEAKAHRAAIAALVGKV